MPVIGVRFATCAMKGQEVWVIPGKMCGYCGTTCSNFDPGSNPYPPRNMTSGNGSGSLINLGQTQRVVSPRSIDMRRMDYIIDQQIYRKPSQQEKLLSIHNSQLDVEYPGAGTNLRGSVLSSIEENIEATGLNLKVRSLEDAAKSIEEAMNAANQESGSDLEEEGLTRIDATKHQKPSTLLTVAFSDVEHIVEPPSQPAMLTPDRFTMKLAWKCTCGHESMDLFPLTTCLEIQEHAEGLVKAGYIKSASLSTSSPSKLQVAFITTNNILTITSNKASALIYKIKRFIAGSKTEDKSPERLSCIAQGDCRWLHVCIKRSIHATGLDVLHLGSQDQQDDPAVFQALRNIYKSQRSMKNTWTSKLRRIDFFEARHDNLVDQIEPNELPTSLKSYDFAPPPPLPPIGRNHMMHLFSSCPSSIPAGMFYFRRLPKKKYEPVSFCADNDEENIGWGLHFVEGFDHAMITYVMFGFTLIVGLMFGVCWTVLKHDVQDAWTISAWITAVMTLGLMAWQSRAMDLDLGDYSEME